jgi:radical SAM protein with 4Fe4S-binding SPASM domain
MSDDLLKSIPDVISKFATKGNTILLQWHGGEPTMFGAKWLRTAINNIESDNRFTWKHGIQTNLMNYDKEFGQLYHDKFNSEVGISWDPGTIRRLKKGEPKSSTQYHKTFFKNLASLVKDGLTPSLVITSTREFFQFINNPYALFLMLEEHKIKYIHIERLTKTGNARDNWESIGVSNKEFSEGMSKLMKAYVLFQSHKEKQTFYISPFDGLMQSVTDNTSGHGCWSGSCDTTFHTIDANGYKSGCSALTSEYDNKRMPEGVVPIKFVSFSKEREVRRGKADCASCEFKSICSSGCLAVDISDGSGECSGGYALFHTAKGLACHHQQ